MSTILEELSDVTNSYTYIMKDIKEHFSIDNIALVKIIDTCDGDAIYDNDVFVGYVEDINFNK